MHRALSPGYCCWEKHYWLISLRGSDSKYRGREPGWRWRGEHNSCRRQVGRPSEVKVTQSCPTLCYPVDSPWNSLSQIFPTQELNPGLPHCGRILYQLSYKGSPRIMEWAAYPFFKGSSWPRNQTRVSCIAGRFFTNWAIREAWKAKGHGHFTSGLYTVHREVIFSFKSSVKKKKRLSLSTY